MLRTRRISTRTMTDTLKQVLSNRVQTIQMVVMRSCSGSWIT